MQKNQQRDIIEDIEKVEKRGRWIKEDWNWKIDWGKVTFRHFSLLFSARKFIHSKGNSVSDLKGEFEQILPALHFDGAYWSEKLTLFVQVKAFPICNKEWMVICAIRYCWAKGSRLFGLKNKQTEYFDAHF